MPAGDRDDIKRLKGGGTRRSLVISILFSIAVLLLVFVFVPDRARALQSLRSFSRQRLVVCAALLVAAWLADTLRLQILTKGIGKPSAFSLAFRAILAGNFMTLITPFLFGGAPVVVYGLKKTGMNWGEATAVVVGGGIVSQCALLTMAVWSMVRLNQHGAVIAWGRLYDFIVPAYAVGLIGFSVLALRADVVEGWMKSWLSRTKVATSRGRNFRLRLVSVGRKLIRNLKEFRKSLRLLARENIVYVAAAYVYALLYFTMMFAMGPVILAGLGVRYSRVTIFALQVLVYVVAGFTPTPGGSGAAELGSFVLLAPVAPVHVIGAFLVVWRLFTFYLNLLAGGIAFTFILREILAEE
ncbi:MAG: flippase-like domain-containing protein [Firmicutes bacterium]|nr:flippase-like domain-containing protein [Bacillota bacterium]